MMRERRRWMREKAIGVRVKSSLCLCEVVGKLLLLNKLWMKHINEYNNKMVKLRVWVVVTGQSRC